MVYFLFYRVYFETIGYTLMDSILEKLVIGAIGGLAAYWFTHMKFVNQKWWDKQFDLYAEAIDILKGIELSLAVLEWGLQNGQYIDTSKQMKEASLEFENGISQLHGLQSKMILIGLKEAQVKVITLVAGLRVIHPDDLLSFTIEDRDEILELVMNSKRITGACSVELALLGKKELKIGITFVTKIRAFFVKK